jgi:hypothetical protein
LVCGNNNCKNFTVREWRIHLDVSQNKNEFRIFPSFQKEQVWEEDNGFEVN